ncbi:tyrosine-type recombinase/integrase [Deinococcus yunweiensis]|uniref:tyrosine-type recombinase/integrase n=1 Tax=Deinococcus yunweiensis TaxID=367282 RepID=UPI00398E6E13
MTRKGRKERVQPEVPTDASAAGEDANTAPVDFAGDRRRSRKKKGNGEGSVWPIGGGRFEWQAEAWVNGQRRTRSGKAETLAAGRKAARAAREELLNERPAVVNTTVGQYVEVWLGRHTDTRERTTQLYRQELGYALERIGGRNLKDIQAGDLKDLQKALSERVMKGGAARGKTMSRRTLGKVMTRLRAVFREAVTDQVITTSPMDGVKRLRQPGKAIEEVSRVLDIPDAARFQALGELLYGAGECRLWPALFVAISIGLRRGEVMGLHWADVDLDRARLRVRQQLTGHRGGMKLSALLKTDAARRTVNLPPSLVAALRLHRDRQRAECQKLGLAWQPAGPVFPTMTGQLTHPDSLNRALNSLVAWSRKAAGTSEVPTRRWGVPAELVAPLQAIFAGADPLPDLSPHDLRHTYATLALRRRVPVEVVSRILGHARVTITLDIYRHVLPSELEEQTVDLFGPPV